MTNTANTAEEAAFRDACMSHDLTYSYSDDGRVYRRGSESLSRVKKMAESLPREDAVRIWNEVVDSKIAEGFRDQFYWRVS